MCACGGSPVSLMRGTGRKPALTGSSEQTKDCCCCTMQEQRVKRRKKKIVRPISWIVLPASLSLSPLSLSSLLFCYLVFAGEWRFSWTYEHPQSCVHLNLITNFIIIIVTVTVAVAVFVVALALRGVIVGREGDDCEFEWHKRSHRGRFGAFQVNAIHRLKIETVKQHIRGSDSGRKY